MRSSYEIFNTRTKFKNYCNKHCYNFVLIGAVVGAVFIAKGKSNVGGKFDISSVAIKHENSVVESLDVEVFSKDIQFDVLINDGESINYKDKPQVTWEIVGDCLNCLVDENGLVQIGNVLGTITLSCTVESENKMTTTLPISITKKAGSTLQTLSATLNDGYSTNYVEGQYFDKNQSHSLATLEIIVL